MLPRTVLPLTSMDSVYQVPVATVRAALASTVTELPSTACNCAWFPGSSASR